MLPRSLSCVLFLFVTVLVATRASIVSATPTFPDVIASKLGAPTPYCGVCHTGTSGSGPATTRFARAMRLRGLTPFDEASLVRALNAVTTEQIDSDRDGTIDVDALRRGLDPNPPEGSALARDLDTNYPVKGPPGSCSISPRVPFAASRAGTLLLLALAVHLFRRRMH